MAVKAIISGSASFKPVSFLEDMKPLGRKGLLLKIPPELQSGQQCASRLLAKPQGCICPFRIGFVNAREMVCSWMCSLF